MNEIQKDILNYIKEHEGTSFVEIENIFKKSNFDYKGDREIVSRNFKNVYYWTGWNKQAISVLTELMKSNLVNFCVASTFIYVVDGKVLLLPQATRWKNYKTPRWVPLAFNITKGVIE